MAGKIKGITIEIGGDTQKLNKALEDVNKKTRDVQSELRQVERLLKLDPKNTELLAQKQKLLAEAVENSREKLNRLKTAQEQVNEQFRKGEINEEQYRAFQREVVKAEQELAKFEKQLRETGITAEKVGQKLKDAGKKMTDMGKNLSTKVTAPLAGLGAVAAKTGMDFEAAMSEVAAISGATGEDLAKLEALAKEMGATTKFSASEAAEGLKYMAMAGWDTQQMLEGLPGVLSLAAASGEDLATVSDILTDAMTAFGMEAARAGEFADILAAASSNANTNVGMLGESFKYVAPVFGSLGYSAEDAALALGLMANAGIKASQAGTALRGAITRMVKPSKDAATAMDELGLKLTDAEGNMLPFRDVMDQLRSTFANLTAEQQAQYAATIFGQEAMSGMLAIINASEADYNKLASAIDNSAGAAQKMADEMQDNLKGRLTELKSALEGVALQLYDHLQPALEKIVEVVQKLVAWFANLSPGVQQTIIIIAGLAAAIGPLLVVLGAMASGLSAIIGILPVLGAALTALTGPVGLVIAGLAAVAAGGYALYRHLQKEAIPEVERFGEEVSEATQQAVGAFMDLNDKATVALNDLAWSGREVTQEMADSLVSTYEQMGDQILASMEEKHAEEIASMQAFFASAQGLTEEEQAEILAKVQEGQELQRKAVEDGQARIEEILRTASEQKRGLTREEAAEIQSIQKQMLETGIEMMSESELEQKAILERMRANASALSAQQAAEVVRNSKKQKDEAIKAAEEQYNEVVKEIIRQRDEVGSISKEQADKLIQEATRQRDEAIKKAEEMHQKVIEEAKKQAEEHVDKVNWETGEVLTKWEVFKNNIKKKWDEIKDFFKKWGDEILLIAVGPAGWAVLLGRKIAENWDSIKTKTSEVWENIKTAITRPIESAKQTVLGIIDTIRNAFANMRIEIPRPKLPKISVDWRSVGVGNAKVNIPDFNINWYKMGGIFSSPSVIGVAEAGDEVVAPLDKLPGLIAEGLKKAMGSEFSFGPNRPIQLVVTLDGRVIANNLYNLQQQNARGRGLK